MPDSRYAKYFRDLVIYLTKKCASLSLDHGQSVLALKLTLNFADVKWLTATVNEKSTAAYPLIMFLALKKSLEEKFPFNRVSF